MKWKLFVCSSLILTMCLRMICITISINRQCTIQKKRTENTRDSHQHLHGGPDAAHKYEKREGWKTNELNHSEASSPPPPPLGKTCSNWNMKWLHFPITVTQIVTKLCVFQAVLSLKQCNIILLLFYFFNEKTIFEMGSPSLWTYFVTNICMKLIPGLLVLYNFLYHEENLNTDLDSQDIILQLCLLFLCIIGDYLYLLTQQMAKGRNISLELIQNNESIFNSKLLNQTDRIKLLDPHLCSHSVQLPTENQMSRKKIPRSLLHPIVSKQHLTGNERGGDLNGMDSKDIPSKRHLFEDVQDSLFFNELIGIIPTGLALLDSSQSVIYNNNQILKLLECDKRDVFKTITNLSTQQNSGANNHFNLQGGSSSVQTPVNNSWNGSQKITQMRGTNTTTGRYKSNLPSFYVKKNETTNDNIQSSSFIFDDQCEPKQSICDMSVQNKSRRNYSASIIKDNSKNNLQVQPPQSITDMFTQTINNPNDDDRYPLSCQPEVRDVKSRQSPGKQTSVLMMSDLNLITNQPLKSRKCSLDTRNVSFSIENCSVAPCLAKMRSKSDNKIEISEICKAPDSDQIGKKIIPKTSRVELEIDLSHEDQQRSLDDQTYLDKYTSNANLQGGSAARSKDFLVTKEQNKSLGKKELPRHHSPIPTDHNNNFVERLSISKYLMQHSREGNGERNRGESHIHFHRKQMDKELTVFQPQLQQRNVKVGNLISNMLESSADTTRMKGFKQSNSKNNLISQISEVLESNYTRNQSLIGQINGNRNLGYYSFRDNVASMQIVHKNKSLVVRLIPCEFEIDEHSAHNVSTENRKDEASLVLILVEPLWEELLEAKMEEHDKHKMQLFGSLCHELRTPLNCSISFLDLYRQLKLGTVEEEEVAEFIEPSLRSNQLMLNMVNDILDFVQMNDNKFKFTPIRFNLIELLQECLLLIKIPAETKRIGLQIQKNDAVPSYITADPNRIRQIVLNFLSNALKFTPQNGNIWIEVEGLEGFIPRGSTLSSVICVTVRDSGIGISQQNIHHIFEIFNKTDHKDVAINPNGCGIGLPLSNSLAKLIGPAAALDKNGKSLRPGIQVQSKEGEGSSFSFNILDLNAPSSPKTRESCDISELKEQEGEVMDNLGTTTLIKCDDYLSEPNIPHLKVMQNYAGGMSLFNFQPSLQQRQQSHLQVFQGQFMHSQMKAVDTSISISSPGAGGCKPGLKLVEGLKARSISDCISEIKIMQLTKDLHSTRSINILSPKQRVQGVPSNLEVFSPLPIRIKSWQDEDVILTPSRNGEEYKTNPIHHKLLEKSNYSLNSKGQKTKILIADDSGFNILVLKKLIEIFHITDISFCHDGLQVVERVRSILGNQEDPNERLFDIIFMDLDMPVMNGYEACKQIKQMINVSSNPHTILPIIACSAFGTQIKDEHTFHISQLDDAISKPVKKDQIEHILETYLHPSKFNHSRL